jgi:Family of unknown function (DUF5670)/Domain of unknown function (DUF4398)
MTGAALAASMALAACATMPMHTSLDEARAAVASAGADPAVFQYDALDLATAQKQLANAEYAAQRDAPEMADHEASLAIGTARLAESRADEARAAQRIVAAD